MDQLLDELADHPHDDELWRVFADWLLAKNDHRGEAVQAFLELQDLGPSPRRDELLDRYAGFCDLGSLGHNRELAYVRWRMGFVYSLSVRTTPEGMAAFTELCRHEAARLLVEIRVTSDDPDRLAELLAHPNLARLKVLEVRPGLPWWHIAVRLPALAELYVEWAEIGPDEMEALGQWSLPRLERLVISGNPLGTAGAQALARSGWLPGLRDLRLSGAEIGDEGLDVLLDACPRALRHLDLEGNRLTRRAASVLATAELTRLSRLDLSRNRIGVQGVGALARASWPRLRKLDLRGTGASTSALEALGRAAGFPVLRELDLHGNRLGPLDLGDFRRTPLGARMTWIGGETR